MVVCNSRLNEEVKEENDSEVYNFSIGSSEDDDDSNADNNSDNNSDSGDGANDCVTVKIDVDITDIDVKDEVKKEECDDLWDDTKFKPKIESGELEADYDSGQGSKTEFGTKKDEVSAGEKIDNSYINVKQMTDSSSRKRKVRSRNNLQPRKRQKTLSNEATRFECETCLRFFYSNENLQQHVRTPISLLMVHLCRRLEIPTEEAREFQALGETACA